MYFFPTLMCNHHQDQMNDIDIIQSQPFSSLPHYFALIWVTVKTVTSNWPRSGNFENHACVQLFATVYTRVARSKFEQKPRLISPKTQQNPDFPPKNPVKTHIVLVIYQAVRLWKPVQKCLPNMTGIFALVLQSGQSWSYHYKQLT